MENEHQGERKKRQPFKAKLRHYHRSASSDLYEKRQKRWEDTSPSDLSGAGKPKTSEGPDKPWDDKGKGSRS